MTRRRLDMAQEGQLWDMALQHFGHDGLLDLVVEIWCGLNPPPKPLVEHFSIGKVSQQVLNMNRPGFRRHLFALN